MEICKHCGRSIFPIPEHRGYQHKEGIGVFCPATVEDGKVVQARFAEPLREVSLVQPEHDKDCESDLASHGYTPCRCEERRTGAAPPGSPGRPAEEA